jgi:hypothetical protein
MQLVAVLVAVQLVLAQMEHLILAALAAQEHPIHIQVQQLLTLVAVAVVVLRLAAQAAQAVAVQAEQAF